MNPESNRSGEYIPWNFRYVEAAGAKGSTAQQEGEVLVHISFWEIAGWLMKLRALYQQGRAEVKEHFVPFSNPLVVDPKQRFVTLFMNLPADSFNFVMREYVRDVVNNLGRDDVQAGYPYREAVTSAVYRSS